MDSNNEKKANKDSIVSNSTDVTDKENLTENSIQKGEQSDLKKLITKIDNRVKTKVLKMLFSVKKSANIYYIYYINIFAFISFGDNFTLKN